MDADLTEQIHEKQRKLGSMLGFVDLVTTFCSICFTSQWHLSHKVRDEPDGVAIYKKLHRGKRGPKLSNLR